MRADEFAGNLKRLACFGWSAADWATAWAACTRGASVEGFEESTAAVRAEITSSGVSLATWAAALDAVAEGTS